MSFSPNFETSQTIGSNSSINFEDTSSGSDLNITQRFIFLQQANGEYLTRSTTSTSYELWSGYPTTTTITLDILDRDKCLNITVQWCDVNGTALYQKTYTLVFKLYNVEFYYGLTQDQTSTPNIVNDTTYYNNKGIFWQELIGAQNASDFAGDVVGAQNCLDRATNMRLNEEKYF